jgi:hypothetical protein
MKYGVFIMQWLSFDTLSFPPSAQRSKVLGSDGDKVCSQVKHDSSYRFVVDGHIEKHPRVRWGFAHNIDHLVTIECGGSQNAGSAVLSSLDAAILQVSVFHPQNPRCVECERFYRECDGRACFAAVRGDDNDMNES